jgi:hypothetical protein
LSHYYKANDDDADGGGDDDDNDMMMRMITTIIIMIMWSDIYAHCEVTVRKKHWENNVSKMTGFFSELWNVREDYVMLFFGLCVRKLQSSADLHLIHSR